MTVRLPDGVLGMARRGEEWADWVARLPRLVEALMAEWRLTQDDIAQHGNCALVLPVRTADDIPAMLKVAFPDEESAHEHLALHHWAGVGAVLLLRADPARRAMLLERLQHRKLDDIDALDACEVVGGLYAELHRPAPPQLRRLSGVLNDWATQLERLPREAPIPRRLVEQAHSITQDFRVDADTDGLLVHGDLHYLNVLAADRRPWLAIDPKPLSGDPHYEVAPMLWNRWAEVANSGNVRDAVRRRFHTSIDAGGLDEHRARDWVVLRETMNVVWELDDPEQGPDWVTASVAIAKAVQD